MDDKQQIQALQLMLQACTEQRNTALDQVNALRAELSMERAKAAQSKAAEPEAKPKRKAKSDSAGL